MIVIKPPFDYVKKIIGDGSKKPDKHYKRSVFLQELPCEEGILLYHSLLKTFVLATEEEYGFILQGEADFDTECGAFFYRNYFLVSDDISEFDTAKNVREVMDLLKKPVKAPNSYTILTTTDCNARCFYCYEIGCEKINMTEDTARKVLARIERDFSVHKKEVKLHWFGGEPLFNASVIDVITEGLKQKAIPFSSQMVSNGYLFDEAMVKKASETWNLKTVQITLDGTEEVYNRRKAYIYKGVNAFERVLHNLELIADAGIEISIRLNMDAGNIADLRALKQELKARFDGNKRVQVYCHLLYQVGEDDKRTYAEYFRFQEELKASKMRAEGMLKLSTKQNRCMADSGYSVVVLPDGRLTSCEHFNEVGEPWGLVDSDEKNEAKYQSFFERYPYEEACKTCVFMPDCIRLKNCPEERESCSEMRRLLRVEDIRQGMLAEYHKWQKNRDTEG